MDHRSHVHLDSDHDGTLFTAFPTSENAIHLYKCGKPNALNLPFLDGWEAFEMFLLPCCILGIDKNRTFISTMQPQTTHFCLYIYSIDLIQFLVYCTQVWPIIRNFPFAVFFTIHCFTNFSIPLLVVFRAEVCKKTHLRRQASGKSPGRVRDYVVFWL